MYQNSEVLFSLFVVFAESPDAVSSLIIQEVILPSQLSSFLSTIPLTVQFQVAYVLPSTLNLTAVLLDQRRLLVTTPASETIIDLLFYKTHMIIER
jgi:hypothetical protein